ncbi:MAG: anthranilate phosphoribosyltransferase [Thermovirgaceae bacterium]|nr:anthranilate phosphoribosyltransferase [Thermovirgaceae bacterium]
MLREYLEKILTRNDLTAEEMARAMEAIMEGRASEAQVAAFLAALRVKGETVVEIASAARVMREKALPVKVDRRPLLDVVGTGGDGTGTFNISTATALVAAAAGVAVAKHGNRSVSSKCGSADVMEPLGIPLLADPGDVADCVERTGFGFIFAPHFHRAMKNVAPVRKALGLRTIFNVLGPLTNPAQPDCLLMGVFTPELVRPMAKVLGRLGLERAMVVHGHGGMDELSLSGSNMACLLKGGVLEDLEITPEDAGLSRAKAGYAAGGTAKDNCRIIKDIFAGKRGTHRDVVVFNAAAALLTVGRAGSLREGARMAEEVIDSGLAAAKLREVAAFAGSRQEGAA